GDRVQTPRDRYPHRGKRGVRYRRTREHRRTALRKRGAPEWSSYETSSSVFLCRSGDSHEMSLRVGEHAERHTGNVLRRLNGSTTKRLRLLERRFDVVDADEEQHRIRGALQRADRGRERALDARVDECVARV